MARSFIWLTFPNVLTKDIFPFNPLKNSALWLNNNKIFTYETKPGIFSLSPTNCKKRPLHLSIKYKTKEGSREDLNVF